MNRAGRHFYYLCVFSFMSFHFFLGAAISFIPEPRLDFRKLYHSSNRTIVGVLSNYERLIQPSEQTKNENEKEADKKPDPKAYVLSTVTMNTPPYAVPTFSLAPYAPKPLIFINFVAGEDKKTIIEKVRNENNSSAKKMDKEKDQLDDCKVPNPLYGKIIHSIFGNDIGYIFVLKKDDGKPDDAVYAGHEGALLTTKKNMSDFVRKVETRFREEQAKKSNDNDATQETLFITDKELAECTNATGELFDAQGLPTSGIKSVVGHGDVIFAALAPHGKEGIFGEEGSAISLIVPHQHQQSLEPVDVQSGEIGKNIPCALDLLPEKGIAYQTKARLGDSIAMYWDNTLKRLFVGLDVSREDASKTGGGTSLLVGHFKPLSQEQSDYNEEIKKENEKRHKNHLPLKKEKKWYCFSLRPLYHQPTQKHDSPISFYREGDSGPLRSVVYGIKIMHTTTDKTFVIINGGLTQTQAHNRIYALPYRARQTYHRLGIHDDGLDEVSECPLYSTVVQTHDSACCVGGGPLPSAEDCPLSTFFVVNDCVYVGLNGPTPGTRGLFKSFPLFKSDGTIAGWSRWQRAFGICDNVDSAWFDPLEFQCLYTTHCEDETTKKRYLVVKKPQWEKPGNGSDIVSILQQHFPVGETTSIKQMYAFDEYTPSFKQGAFSMIAAHSYNKLALVETGNNASGEFLPISCDDSREVALRSDGRAPEGGENCKALIFSGGALDELQFIQTMAISRSNTENQGYVFVGGIRGCVVLSNDEGDGWNSNEGLSRGFQGIDSSFSFKKIGSFSDVRKIEADDQHVYILTPHQLYRIALTKENFSREGSLNPKVEEVLSASELDCVLCDCLVLQDLLVLGTSRGAYYAPKETSQGSAAWRPIIVQGKPLHSVTKLSATSIRDSEGKECSVVNALELFITRNTSFAHRLSVYDGLCDAIKEPNNHRAFISFGRRELFFQPYGDVVFYQPIKKNNEKSTLNFSPSIKNISISPYRGLMLNIDNIYNPDFEISAMVQDSASGKWIVSGSQGLRIFE